MIDVSKINTDRVNEPKLVFLENVSGNINLSCDKIYVFEVLNILFSSLTIFGSIPSFISSSLISPSVFARLSIY